MLEQGFNVESLLLINMQSEKVEQGRRGCCEAKRESSLMHSDWPKIPVNCWTCKNVLTAESVGKEV